MAARIVLMGLLAVSLAAADTLTLRDGSVLEGKFFGGSSQEVRFVVGEELRFFSLNEIARITVGPPLPRASAPQPECPEVAVPACPASTEQAPKPAPAPAPAEQLAASSGEIPAGTSLLVRMIEEVDSSRQAAGQAYRALLDEPVVVQGRTMLAKGTEVLAQLTLSSPGGPGGPSVYGLELVSITIDGQRVGIKTSQAGLPVSGNRQRAKLGGLTRAAARLGRVFGGASGGQAGGTAQEVGDTIGDVALGGSGVRVAPDTRLRFTLIGRLTIGSSADGSAAGDEQH